VSGRDRPKIRELILRLGMRPWIVDGQWDGYSMIDDGSGRLHAWLDSQGATGTPIDGPRRTALIGAMEKEARRMAAEGIWGEEMRPAEQARRAKRRRY